MSLHKLRTPAYLIVNPESTIVGLALLLGLDTYIKDAHDHLYIQTDSKNTFKAVASYNTPSEYDVRVTPEVFSEILIDIASGIELREAFQKQGYTF